MTFTERLPVRFRPGTTAPGKLGKEIGECGGEWRDGRHASRPLQCGSQVPACRRRFHHARNDPPGRGRASAPQIRAAAPPAGVPASTSAYRVSRAASRQRESASERFIAPLPVAESFSCVLMSSLRPHSRRVPSSHSRSARTGKPAQGGEPPPEPTDSMRACHARRFARAPARCRDHSGPQWVCHNEASLACPRSQCRRLRSGRSS